MRVRQRTRYVSYDLLVMILTNVHTHCVTLCEKKKPAVSGGLFSVVLLALVSEIFPSDDVVRAGHRIERRRIAR